MDTWLTCFEDVYPVTEPETVVAPPDDHPVRAPSVPCWKVAACMASTDEIPPVTPVADMDPPMHARWAACMEELRCPLTHLLLWQPVLTSDGHVFEEHALQTWFARAWEEDDQRLLTQRETLDEVDDSPTHRDDGNDGNDDDGHRTPTLLCGRSPLSRSLCRIVGPPPELLRRTLDWVVACADPQWLRLERYCAPLHERWRHDLGWTWNPNRTTPLARPDQIRLRDWLYRQPAGTLAAPDDTVSFIEASFQPPYRWLWKDRPLLRHWLWRSDLDWSAADAHGWTLLHNVMYLAPGAVVCELIKFLTATRRLAPPVWAQCTEMGRNPLHLALRWQDQRVLRALWDCLDPDVWRDALRQPDCMQLTPWASCLYRWYWPSNSAQDPDPDPASAEDFASPRGRRFAGPSADLLWWRMWEQLARHPGAAPAEVFVPVAAVPRRRPLRARLFDIVATIPETMWMQMAYHGTAALWDSMWNYEAAPDPRAVVEWWWRPVRHPRTHLAMWFIAYMLMDAPPDLDPWLGSVLVPLLDQCLRQVPWWVAANAFHAGPDEARLDGFPADHAMRPWLASPEPVEVAGFYPDRGGADLADAREPVLTLAARRQRWAVVAALQQHMPSLDMSAWFQVKPRCRCGHVDAHDHRG